MTDTFTMVWSFRNIPEVLLTSVLSADAQCPADVKFILVDGNSSADSLKKIRAAISLLSRDIRICESHYRTTCQEAWNLGIMLTDSRYVIIASSDVVFLRAGWFEDVRDTLNSCMKYTYITNHAIFAFDKSIIPTVGWFDETYRYGPHVDCDYLIRLSEKGIPFTGIENQGYYTHGDDEELNAIRFKEEVPDRLSYVDYTNDAVFKEKWASDWPGWAHLRGQTELPHPPTRIFQVVRQREDVDPHPFYTKRCIC